MLADKFRGHFRAMKIRDHQNIGNTLPVFKVLSVNQDELAEKKLTIVAVEEQEIRLKRDYALRL